MLQHGKLVVVVSQVIEQTQNQSRGDFSSCDRDRSGDG